MVFGLLREGFLCDGCGPDGGRLRGLLGGGRERFVVCLNGRIWDRDEIGIESERDLEGIWGGFGVREVDREEIEVGVQERVGAGPTG